MNKDFTNEFESAVFGIQNTQTAIEFDLDALRNRSVYCRGLRFGLDILKKGGLEGTYHHEKLNEELERITRGSKSLENQINDYLIRDSYSILVRFQKLKKKFFNEYDEKTNGGEIESNLGESEVAE